MLIKWNYPFVKNIETLKLCKKRHFARNGLAQSKIVPREAFLIVDNPAFFPFFVKKQKKRLQKKMSFTKFVAQFRRVPLPMLSGLTEVLEAS
ncbi:MAG: hypothetical protein J6P30_10120 [Fibrobacter sp.]|nr:hypothetical protein [Fibrobacter sp.]